MCNISVIIPFYKGNKYLTGLKQSLENACISYEGKVEVMRHYFQHGLAFTIWEFKCTV